MALRLTLNRKPDRIYFLLMLTLDSGLSVEALVFDENKQKALTGGSVLRLSAENN